MHSTQRRSFTLLETIIVIAIIAVVVALLLSGIQSSRRAADRTQCSNNVRQLSIAFHQYHTEHFSLPLGSTIVNDNSTNDPFPGLCWTARLLPYLGEDSLWLTVQESYRLDPYFPNVDVHTGRFVKLSIFRCPADTIRQRVDADLDHSEGTTSYAGVVGKNDYLTDGLLFGNSQIRFADITDGTSNTLLVGERPPNLSPALAVWYSGSGYAPRAFLGVRETRLSDWNLFDDCPSGPYHFKQGDLKEKCSFMHFWSLHRRGANFLFADGHVSFIRYEADPLLPALATRAGGEAAILP